MARVAHDRWGVSKWKGTVETLLGASQELADAVPEPEHPRSAHIRIEWEGGREDFASLEALHAARGTVPWDRVSEVFFSYRETLDDQNAPYHQVSLLAYAGGLVVSAEGPNAAIVHGLVRIGEERLAAGEHGDFRRVPFTNVERLRAAVTIALAVVGVASAVVLTAVTGEGRYWNLIYLGLLGLFVWPIHAGKEWAPALMLVTPEHEQAERTERPGLTVRIRDWVRERPLTALVATFTLGVLTNLVANLITSD